MKVFIILPARLESSRLPKKLIKKNWTVNRHRAYDYICKTNKRGYYNRLN